MSAGLPLASLQVREHGMRPSGTATPVARRSTPWIRCRRLLPLLGRHRLKRVENCLPLQFNSEQCPPGNRGAAWGGLSPRWFLHDSSVRHSGREPRCARAACTRRQHAAPLRRASSSATAARSGRDLSDKAASVSRNQLRRPAATGAGRPRIRPCWRWRPRALPTPKPALLVNPAV